MYPIVKKSQLVILTSQGIGSGNSAQRLQFTDQPYLRFKSILGLEVFSAADLALSPLGNALPTIGNLQNAYITFYTNDPDVPGNGNMQSPEGEWIQNLPLLSLRRMSDYTPGNPFEQIPFLMFGQTIIWEKSYITLAAPLNNESNLDFCINVLFQDGSNTSQTA